MTKEPEKKEPEKNPAISIGMLRSENEKLKAQVEELNQPYSPMAESTKEMLRYVLSFLLAIAIASLYQRYPVLGELQPDQTTVVIFVTGLLIRGLDKAWYHYQRNKGKSTKGLGLDLPLRALSSLFTTKKDKTTSGK